MALKNVIGGITGHAGDVESGAERRGSEQRQPEAVGAWPRGSRSPSPQPDLLTDRHGDADGDAQLDRDAELEEQRYQRAQPATPSPKKRSSWRGSIQPSRLALRAITRKQNRNMPTKSKNWSSQV